MEYNADRLLAKQLLEMRVLNAEQLAECQKVQQSMPRPLPLAFILIDKGFLTDNNLAQVVQYQKDYFRFLAKYDVEYFLGRELIELGLITEDQLNECLAIQAQQSFPIPLVFILGERGYLGEAYIQKIVAQQTDYFQEFLGKTKNLGQICLEQKWISKKQLQQALKIQKCKWRKHRVKFPLGKILLSQKLISEEQLLKALELQGKKILTCSKCHKSFNIRHFKAARIYPCPECNGRLVPKGKSSAKRAVSGRRGKRPKEPIASAPIAEEALATTDAVPNKLPEVESDQQMQISKAVIVIEQALENTNMEQESQEEEVVGSSTTWWMTRIDDLLAAQPEKPSTRRQYATAQTSQRLPLLKPRARSKIEWRYLLGALIGVALFPLMLIGFNLWQNAKAWHEQRTTPPCSPPSGTNSGSSGRPAAHESSTSCGSNVHTAGHEPTGPPEQHDQPTTTDLAAGQTPSDPSPAVQPNNPVSPVMPPSAAATPLQRKIRNLPFSKMPPVIDSLARTHQLQAADLKILQSLYQQANNCKALRYAIIRAAVALPNPAKIDWLEEILQTGSVLEQNAVVYALRSMNDARAAQCLLNALRNIRHEHLAQLIAQILCRMRPKDYEVFQALTDCFQNMRNFSTRRQLLRLISKMQTGQEDLFLLQLIANTSLSRGLRKLALECLLYLFRKGGCQGRYYDQLQRIQQEEPDRIFCNYLKAYLPSFSR